MVIVQPSRWKFSHKYGIKISAVCSFVLSQSMHVTDGRTDKITTPKTALALLRRAVKIEQLTTTKLSTVRKSTDKKMLLFSGGFCCESYMKTTLIIYSWHQIVSWFEKNKWQCICDCNSVKFWWILITFTYLETGMNALQLSCLLFYFTYAVNMTSLLAHI